MTRGKHGDLAKNRRISQLEIENAALESQVASLKTAAHEADLRHKDEMRAEANRAALITAEHVSNMMTGRLDKAAEGLSNACWQAQRVAMTEHLTWLFFKGLVTWDRFSGDREVLKFLMTHGNLDTWFALTSKYGHHHNHKDRRSQAKIKPFLKMLEVLRDIQRAEDGQAGYEASRKGLDDVVDYARTQFIDVALHDVMLLEGITVEPTEEAFALYAELEKRIPEFRRFAAAVGQ